MLHEKMDFMCYLAVPQPNLGRFRGDSLTNPMLITAFFILIWKGVSLEMRLSPLTCPNTQRGMNQYPSDLIATH